MYFHGKCLYHAPTHRKIECNMPLISFVGGIIMNLYIMYFFLNIKLAWRSLCHQCFFLYKKHHIHLSCLISSIPIPVSKDIWICEPHAHQLCTPGGRGGGAIWTPCGFVYIWNTHTTFLLSIQLINHNCLVCSLYDVTMLLLQCIVM